MVRREREVMGGRRAEGEGEMTDNNPNETSEMVGNEPGPLPPRAVDVPFLITASELRDRKKRRRTRDHW